MKRYFISVDLEGVHGVVGEPYSGLNRKVSDYPVAVESATAEINSAALKKSKVGIFYLQPCER